METSNLGLSGLLSVPLQIFSMSSVSGAEVLSHVHGEAATFTNKPRKSLAFLYLALYAKQHAENAIDPIGDDH